MRSIWAVIVTYRPDAARLAALLRSLAHEVDRAVLVDNGTPHLAEDALRGLYPRLAIERFPANRGLAAAQNRGVAVAKAAGATHVLFLDQDSLPQPGMTRILLDTLRALQAGGVAVACIGPRHRAPEYLSRFTRLGWLGPSEAPCSDDGRAAECDALMSSGTLVPVPVLEDVGGLEQALFIDQVDTEWCLRARARGYRVFGACHAVLEHRLGESSLRLWLGRWRRLFRHQPFRYYYIFRNTLLLCRRDYVELKFVAFHLVWLAVLLVAFGAGRSGELRMMLKGIAHGLQGVKGELATEVLPQ